MKRLKTKLATCLLLGSMVVICPHPASAYEVKAGDTLWDISQQYNVSLAQLETANNLRDDSVLQIGEHLVIPGSSTSSSNAGYSSSITNYKVQSGDTLWGIATRYGTTVSAIMSANNLSSCNLQIGQTLKIPTSYRCASSEVSRGSSRADSIVEYARRFVGTPYVYAGSAPGGFDCSGFVCYVLSHFGIYLPHNSFAQYGYGTPVQKSQLLPGDLVFFDTCGGASHVGIYVGGGDFISATLSHGVDIESLDYGYWAARYIGARRL